MTLSLPFSNAAPTRTIWVSPDGNNGNSGAEGSPLRTIQEAVNQAKGHPGTAIMVKAGTYHENLKLNGLHGTKEAPIELISADGPQAAKIVGGPDAATITGYGISHVGIYDFHVVSNTSSGDIGGFKLWGPWSAPATGLAIAGNLITGKGQDGFKLFNGAKDCLIVGNTINGTWRQEAIDNVSIEDVTYAFNTIRGSFGYTGLTVKTGSRDVQIVGNDIDGKGGTGLFIGGFGNSHATGVRSFDAKEWGGYDAARVHAHGNVIGDGHSTSVSFIGARDSVLASNQLAGAVRSVNHREEGRGLFDYGSHDNQILNNSVEKEGFFKPKAGQDKGYVVSGNTVGGGAPDAGTDAALAKAAHAALVFNQQLPPELASIIVAPAAVVDPAAVNLGIAQVAQPAFLPAVEPAATVEPLAPAPMPALAMDVSLTDAVPAAGEMAWQDSYVSAS
ncbi:right-handed parallel beta-helix repeat-containing protein [Arenibaculum pallidiluteum]|uniref:right-handed parallel beta-helix repeat-containing protein n=1 Tax=Arenibaculum pallidiluteum TaxID=2812559 RepID=UPI001A96CF2B|nr:right-handed parallel beta-helix repeat-containing protein [Arenibaculum pallidiluteum]